MLFRLKFSQNNYKFEVNGYIRLLNGNGNWKRNGKGNWKDNCNWNGNWKGNWNGNGN